MKIEQDSLRVNHLREPFLDSEPVFSWKLSAGDKEEQKACRLEVWEHDGRLVWSSEDVPSEENRISAAGCPLAPCTEYRWRVTVTGQDGGTDQADSRFATGMRGGAWKGIWITGHECDKPDDVERALYLRKEFCAAKLRRAVLYVAGPGYFEAYLNGRRVGDDYFSTPCTVYDKHILYRAYEVTGLVEEGANALGVILGNGFYNCFTADPWQTATAPWRAVPKLLCELRMENKDGTEAVVASGLDWAALQGPIVFNGIRHGETYDARLEQDGWTQPGYRGETQPASQTLNPGAELALMEMEPIRVRKKYRPVRCWQAGDAWMFDIGQDVSGIANITFHGPRGSVHTVRYSDRLNGDGTLDQASLSMFIKNYNFQTDTYIKRTDEAETWHATFAYYGIQYLEVRGPGPAPQAQDIEVWALCNDFAQRGVFETNDRVLNGIQHMALSSTTACCLNTMASDTVREKSSWTGDTGLSCEQMLYNFETEQFFAKWMQDLRDTQRPAGSLPCIVPCPGWWGYRGIVGPDWCNPMYAVPWEVYQATGDLRILRENYDALLKHCAYMRSMAIDEIVQYGLGDWCAPFEGPALSVNMEKFKCPVAVSDTAFRYAAVCGAREWASLLGKQEDAAKLHAEAAAIRASFRRNFYDAEHCRVAGDCQSSTAMMLYYGFADPGEAPALVRRLLTLIEQEDGHLDFGILGMKSVLNVLGRYGYVKEALGMIANPTYPSYRHWLDQGATTLWECWNGGGSHCHHMFSDVSAFFYKYVAGILPTQPGYRTILLCPALTCGVGQVRCRVNTVRGVVECSYTVGDKMAELCLEVPHGAQATLRLPGRGDRLFSVGRYQLTVAL